MNLTDILLNSQLLSPSDDNSITDLNTQTFNIDSSDLDNKSACSQAEPKSTEVDPLSHLPSPPMTITLRATETSEEDQQQQYQEQQQPAASSTKTILKRKQKEKSSSLPAAKMMTQNMKKKLSTDAVQKKVSFLNTTLILTMTEVSANINPTVLVESYALAAKGYANSKNSKKCAAMKSVKLILDCWST